MNGSDLLVAASWGERRYTRFDDMEQGEYEIRYFEIVNTSYGLTIKAELENDKYVLLPKRFAEDQNAEKIADANTYKWKMIYRGKDVTQRNL